MLAFYPVLLTKHPFCNKLWNKDLDFMTENFNILVNKLNAFKRKYYSFRLFKGLVLTIFFLWQNSCATAALWCCLIAHHRDPLTLVPINFIWSSSKVKSFEMYSSLLKIKARERHISLSTSTFRFLHRFGSSFFLCQS